MITGDIKETAKTIAKQVHIIRENDTSSNCYTSSEFDTLQEHEQSSLLSSAMKNNSGLVFARAEPRHKRSLIKLLSNLVYYTYYHLAFVNLNISGPHCRYDW